MRISKLKIFSIALAIFSFYAPIIDGEEHLRYAAILYRHGDRTPIDPYPTDPWKNESWWPVKFGQLTNIGKLQHYLLGQWLRTRYDNLISSNYDPAEISVRSTNVDRTLMSALTNLAGLYPPKESSVWNAMLLWQPIPVHTVPEDEDEILAMNKKCPNYETAKRRMMNSLAYKQRLSKYQKLMNYLSVYTGRKVKDYVDILNVYSVLRIEQLYNFTLPDWTSAVFPHQMAEPAGYSFTLDTATPLMARLKVGPLIKEIVDNMVKVMHQHNSKIPYHAVHYKDLDAPAKKLNIYSAHDLNVGSLLNGLRVFDGRCPAYTATVLMELVYDDAAQIHFVKILYRNTTEIVEPMPLFIPHCGYRCPLERFVQLYDDIIPEDWEAECTQKFPLALALTGVISGFLLLASYICHYYPCCGGSRRRRYNNTRYCNVRPDRELLKPAAI